MGSNATKLSPKSINELRQHVDVDFTREEILEWYEEYSRARTSKRGLQIQEFREIYNSVFEGDGTEFAKHVFRTFDSNMDGRVDFKEFIVGLCVSGSDNIETKLRWAFSMYDIDRNGSVTRKEMESLLTAIFRMTANTNQDVTAKSLTAEFFTAADDNHDDLISKEEFVQGAKKHPVMIDLLQGESSMLEEGTTRDNLQTDSRKDYSSASNVQDSWSLSEDDDDDDEFEAYKARQEMQLPFKEQKIRPERPGRKIDSDRSITRSTIQESVIGSNYRPKPSPRKKKQSVDDVEHLKSPESNECGYSDGSYRSEFESSSSAHRSEPITSDNLIAYESYRDRQVDKGRLPNEQKQNVSKHTTEPCLTDESISGKVNRTSEKKATRAKQVIHKQDQNVDKQKHRKDRESVHSASAGTQKKPTKKQGLDGQGEKINFQTYYVQYTGRSEPESSRPVESERDTRVNQHVPLNEQREFREDVYQDNHTKTRHGRVKEDTSRADRDVIPRSAGRLKKEKTGTQHTERIPCEVENHQRHIEDRRNVNTDIPPLDLTGEGVPSKKSVVKARERRRARQKEYETTVSQIGVHDIERLEGNKGQQRGLNRRNQRHGDNVGISSEEANSQRQKIHGSESLAGVSSSYTDKFLPEQQDHKYQQSKQQRGHRDVVYNAEKIGIGQDPVTGHAKDPRKSEKGQRHKLQHWSVIDG